MATTVTAVNIAETAAKIIKQAEAFKLPKDAAAVKGMSLCADELYTTKQERFALSKALDALKAKEAMLTEHFIENLSKESTGVAGKVARASIQLKTVVQVEDWSAFYKFVAAQTKKDPGAWSLLQKRVGEGAVKEYWEAHKKVPGVIPFDVKVVSLNKVG